MTPEEKKSIRAALQSAGISNNAIRSSLLERSQNDIRLFITDKKWKGEKNVYRGLYLYPAQSPSQQVFTETFANSELVFKIAAKEMMREGCKVHVISLLNLLHRLRDRDYDPYDEEGEFINRASIVFISGFYWGMEEVSPFQNGYDKTAFIDWLLARYDNGKAISCSSTSPLVEAKAWWPQMILQLIAKNTETFIIK